MKWDPAYLKTFVIYNYAEQAEKAAALMQAQHQQMADVIEQMEAEGYSLKLIHYDF